MSESVFIDLHVNMEPNVLFRGHNYTSRRWHLINPVSYLTSRLKKKLKWKYGASINHMTPKSAPFYPLPLMTHLAHYKVNGMTIFLSLLTPSPLGRVIWFMNARQYLFAYFLHLFFSMFGTFGGIQ